MAASPGNHFVGVPFLAGEGKNLDIVFVGLISGFHEGEFRLAGAAPGGPEVDKDHLFLFQGIIEAVGLAVKGGKAEVRDTAAQLGRSTPFSDMITSQLYR